MLSGLSSHPTAEELHAAGRELAIAVSDATYPIKSLAAFRRHHASFPYLDEIIGLAEAELPALEARPTDSETSLPEWDWLGVEAVAYKLKKRVQAVRDDLRTVAGRRTLGWAWWDCHRWRIPEPAINPMMRAQFLSTLPETEPAAHVALLPPWCERE
jgi:hypothetical protein